MQFKVPQNIDMEDRIFGPLTMVQFIYAVVGGGIAYSLYSSTPQPIGYFLAIPVLILTLAVVFVKINERPFLLFLSSVIHYFTSPRERVWHQGSMNNMEVELYTARKIEKKKAPMKDISREEIANLAKRLDEGGGN